MLNVGMLNIIRLSVVSPFYKTFFFLEKNDYPWKCLHNLIYTAVDSALGTHFRGLCDTQHNNVCCYDDTQHNNTENVTLSITTLSIMAQY
jgi:hypothetical protein